MEKSRKWKEDNQFIDCWEKINSSNNFLAFDTFVIRELGFEFVTKEELEQIRRPAFLKFRKKTKHYDFASMPTMRRWFGIGGIAIPDREQVFAICLALKTGTDKAGEYLTVGLGESSFQFRDYRELIFHYGLYNELTYEECQSLIQRFEVQWIPNLSGESEEEEKKFLLEYNRIKKKRSQELLSWMLQYSDFFMGYSQKTLDVLMTCRKEVIEFIRREAKDKLESLLAETDYATWRKGKKYQNLSMREVLRRYVKAHQSSSYYKVSQNMRDNILELSQIAYSKLEANSKLLSEVFSISRKKEKQKGGKIFRNVKGMTSKHLSDLFNIPLQKKRFFLMRQGNYKLCDLAPEVTCPEWFQEMADICAKKHPDFATVQEAREWLTYYYSEQKRRCIDISRNDILPLAHYIAQHRYLEELNRKNDVYNAEQAKREFIILANKVLEQCQMAPIDENYELDAVLLTCFQPDEMYSFSEILDMARGIEQ